MEVPVEDVSTPKLPIHEMPYSRLQHLFRCENPGVIFKSYSKRSSVPVGLSLDFTSGLIPVHTSMGGLGRRNQSETDGE